MGLWYIPSDTLELKHYIKGPTLPLLLRWYTLKVRTFGIFPGCSRPLAISGYWWLNVIQHCLGSIPFISSSIYMYVSSLASHIWALSNSVAYVAHKCILLMKDTIHPHLSRRRGLDALSECLPEVRTTWESTYSGSLIYMFLMCHFV